MKQIHVLLFYKFTKIAKPQTFAAEHLEACKRLGLLGRILIAEEGINGSVAGTEDKTEAYKKLLRSTPGFEDVVFKEDLNLSCPFKRMIVKAKKEIINFGQQVNLDNKAPYISSQELVELYRSGKDFILLDARNEYESRVGKFKNAITPPLKTFRDFPAALEPLKDKKDALIVTYCTGGIRCEKASAYMREQGFTNVKQLDGGILTFGKQFPNTVWEGTCFVFDKRLVSPINEGDTRHMVCESCGVVCDLYKNCAQVDCDRYVVICTNCDDRLQGCCSEACFKTHSQRKHKLAAQCI